MSAQTLSQLSALDFLKKSSFVATPGVVQNADNSGPISATDPIGSFVDSVMAELDLKDLKSNERDVFRQNMIELCEKAIQAELIAALNPDQQKQLLTLMESGADSATTQQYINSSVDNIQDVVANALIEVANRYSKII